MSDYANTEGLIIEIEASAGSADSELKALTDTLNEFKSAISNSRSFGTFSRNIDKLTASIAKIDNNMISRLTALSTLGTSLQAINSVKISDTIAKQIEQIGLATLMVTPQALSRLQLLSTTLSGFSLLAGFKFPATIANNLQKIVNIATGLDNATIARLKDLVDALMPLGALASVDTSNLQTVAQSLRSVSTAANKASQRGRHFNTVMANIRVKTVAAIYALRKVVSVITESLDVYGDYIETLNLFSVSMGEASKSAYEYAETVQDILGIDMTQWMKSQGVFMTLAKGFGIATDRAAVMSQQLTQLAYDISSFYNISVEDAVQKVQSAFSGELEPVRRLGFDLSQAKLQAIALSLGIDESVKSMDQAEKGSLRYYALLTQVTDAQGDLARTLESPTNQLRIFSAQINQLVRSLGMVFIPVLNKVLPYLNAVARVLKWILDEIAALFGYTLPGVDWSGVTTGVEEGIGGIEKEIEDTTGAAEKLKNTLASFDEINLIGSKSGGTGKGKVETPGGGGFDFELPTYDFLGEATENRAKAIAETIKKHITPAVDFLKDAIMYIRDNWDKIYATAKLLVGLIAGVKLMTKLSGIIDALKNIDKEALGISVAIAGITIAFSGGSDLADGDLFKGLIETAFGTALASIGGAIYFGQIGGAFGAGVGAVLGFSLGIAAAVIGFQMEANANYKADVDAVFYAVDKGKMSMDEFVASWGDFASAIVGNAEGVKQAFKGVAESNEAIYTITNNMSALDVALANGTITMGEYKTSLVGLFQEMGNQITSGLRAAKDTIEIELSGSLGTFLTNAGITVSGLKAMMADSSEAIEEALRQNQASLIALNTAHSANLISTETYNEKVKILKEQMAELTGTTDLTSEAVEKFNKASQKGVNLESLETTLDGLQRLNESYTSSFETLEEKRDAVISSLEKFKADPRPGMKEYYQGVIEEANAYYDEQEKLLQDKLKEMLDQIQISSLSGMESVYDTKGIDAFILEFEEDATKINDAMDKIYSGAGLGERQNEAYEALDGFIKTMREKQQELIDDALQVNDKLRISEGSGLGQAIANYYKEFDDSTREVADRQVGKYLQYLKDLDDGVVTATERTGNHMGELSEAFSFDFLTSDESDHSVNAFIKSIEDAEPLLDTAVEDCKSIFEKLGDIDFSSIASDSVDDLTNGIGEQEDKIKKSGGAVGGWLLDGYNASIDPVSIGVTTTLFGDIIEQRLLDEQTKVGDASGKLGSGIVDSLSEKTEDIKNVTGEWITGISDVLRTDTEGQKATEDWFNGMNDSMKRNVSVFDSVGKDIRKSIVDAANGSGTDSFSGFGMSVIDTISSGMENNLSPLLESAGFTCDNLYEYLNDGIDDIGLFGDDVINVISDQVEDGARNGKLKPATDAIADTLYTDLTDSLSAMENYGYSVLTNIRTGLDNAGEKDRVLQSVRNMKNSIKGEFSTMADDIEKTVNDMLKRLANQFNQFQIKAEFNTKAPNLNQSNVPGYASGGFPTSGELFVANENGIAEYIGSMGGKTAVANNTEIIQGVSDGVYKALRETGLVQDVKALTKKKSDVVFAPSKEAGRVMQQSANLYNGAGGRY